MKRFPIKLLYYFTAVFLLGSSPLSAQNSPLRMSNNVVYAEALGVGGYYSLNYERVLFQACKERLMVSASMGGSYYYRPRDIQRIYFLERLNVAYGIKDIYLEIGVNVILARKRSYSFRDYWLAWNNAGTLFPHAGIRFQRKNWPFLKVYIFPIHNDAYNDFYLYLIDKPWKGPEWYWWGGFAIGYAF